MSQFLEGALEKTADEKMASGSAGVCVSDVFGLPLMTRGTLKCDAAALGTQLLSLAAQLDPAAAQQNSPVVVLNSEHNHVTFSKENDTVVAVHTTH